MPHIFLIKTPHFFCLEPWGNWSRMLATIHAACLRETDISTVFIQCKDSYYFRSKYSLYCPNWSLISLYCSLGISVIWYSTWRKSEIWHMHFIRMSKFSIVCQFCLGSNKQKKTSTQDKNFKDRGDYLSIKIYPKVRLVSGKHVIIAGLTNEK